MEPYFNPLFPSSFLSTDQFNIHYVHKGSGPSLMMLHGGGTWLYSFRHNIDELSRHFSVYAMDLPGHGYTKPLTKRTHYDSETVSSALIGFMEKIGITTAHLVGHSWGGGWAIHFAHRYPSRVSKLVLLDSSGLNRREHLVWEFMKIPFIGDVLFELINAHAIRKSLRDSFYDKIHVSPEMVFQILTPLKIKENRKAQLSYARRLNWRKTETVLAQIKCPALLVWGCHDRYIDVQYGHRMADLMVNSRLIILENCGHSSHEECPEKVNRLMIDFLK